ncbi:death-associated protein kinase 1-like isoform X3 [Oscarella lobularis]|uniref:death-associated protein kinase 1-like isoform X3 n=1 Tax=Oscarella lobularis TaxID=121494 RepID=UPI003313650E
MSRFSSAKKAKIDVEPLLRQRGISSVRSTIDRLAKIIKKWGNEDELRRFLSTEKGFPSDQYNPFGWLLIHYVAGREFDSAELADEWLSYALGQNNQDIQKESGGDRRRPLHCACKWGNIFGVEWLVDHGANVNVKDLYGCTPYYYACLSSVDTMRKIEEHGYILSPFDIVWAAQNQFSSSEKANEIFDHLVNKKGLSVNAIEEMYGYTPLHHACHDGSIFGMKWLVEHKADINSVDKRGITPFMLACKSPINRSAKVRYLDEKGADCQAKDHDGRTALFHATWASKCKDDDVKDVLRYLVIEKGIDINSVDEEGETPLLYACDKHYPYFLVIQHLIELGADVSVRNKNKQNALHMVAKTYLERVDASVIDLLIKKGADVTCQDQDGKAAYEVAEDGERRALLRQHYDAARFSVLRQEIVRQDSIKLCVIGKEMAGKTTLVNSLLQLNQSLPREDRTPGVQIHNCEISGVGKGSTWDFGAQPTFHSAHGLFFRQSNTIFVLVLRCDGQETTSEIVLLEIGRYWCAFVKAALRTLSSRMTSRLRLLIIFNLIDFEEETGNKVSFLLKRVFETLQEEFKDTFEILHMFEMDCSKSNSVCMNDFRERLKAIRENMLEEAHGVPKLCHVIEQKLCLPNEEGKSSLRNFMKSEEFVKWVVEDVGIRLNEDERKVSVEYLDSSGIIVNLGPQICPRPLWLCHNVVGPLLAPPYFPFGMPSEKSGEVSLKDIDSALRAFEDDLKKRGTPSSYTVTVEEAIWVLLCLDLCIEVENSPGTFQIPALLQHSIPKGSWVEDAMFDVYRGQRYECSLSVDIISPSSFVVFQSRCSRMAKPTSREAWKDGVKLIRIVDDKVVESRIELGIKKGHCCIDVILRWSSKAACDKVAKDFLAEIKDMIMRACDERSPGVILNLFYLDSKHLKQLDEDPAIYSMAEVEKKVNQQAFDHVLFSFRPEKGHYSSIRNLSILTEEEVSASRRGERMLLAPHAAKMRQDNPKKKDADPHVAALPVTFPADDDLLSEDLIKACAAVKGSKWEEIGCLLLSFEKVEDIRKPYGGNFVHMIKVLEAWNTAKSPTVGQLLAAFEAVGVNGCHIKKKYEELRRTVFK